MNPQPKKHSSVGPILATLLILGLASVPTGTATCLLPDENGDCTEVEEVVACFATTDEQAAASEPAVGATEQQVDASECPTVNRNIVDAVLDQVPDEVDVPDEIPTACEDNTNAACYILANGPGEIRMGCSVGGFVCAQASAHAEYEEIKGVPNAYSHMTSGMGMNPNGLAGGSATFQTTLGVGTCSFGPGEGCGDTWTDVASVCKPMWAKTTAVVMSFGATAAAQDSIC